MDQNSETNQGNGAQTLSKGEVKRLLLPPRPKRPLSAFNLFMRDYINGCIGNGDNRNVREIFREGTVEWQYLSDDQRKVYEDQYQEVLQAFTIAMEAWKKQKEQIKGPCPPFASFIRDIWQKEREKSEQRSVPEVTRHAAKIWNQPALYKRKFTEELQCHQKKLAKMVQEKTSLTGDYEGTSSEMVGDHQNQDEEMLGLELDREVDMSLVTLHENSNLFRTDSVNSMKDSDMTSSCAVLGSSNTSLPDIDESASSNFSFTNLSSEEILNYLGVENRLDDESTVSLLGLDEDIEPVEFTHEPATEEERSGMEE